MPRNRRDQDPKPWSLQDGKLAILHTAADESARSAVVVTILLTPVALLLAVQWKFLPYHSAWITLDHQAVFTFDLLLV